MEDKIKIAYSEIFEILKYMDKSQVMKIPIEILENFKENRLQNYKSKINKDDIFNKNNITRETLSILGYLNLNYWSSNEKKRDLLALYRKNEYELSKRNEEQYDNIFHNKNIDQNTFDKNPLNEEKWLVEYKKTNLFILIFNKIKSYFNLKRQKRNRY